LVDLQTRYGAEKLPNVLALQLDNCSDNKAKAVLGWCGMLRRRGVFKEIRVSFLIRGHTHEVRCVVQLALRAAH
jgi:hypothetical protein